jgi:hypothetical protein
VQSRTPPGQAIEPIASRRPYDDRTTTVRRPYDDRTTTVRRPYDDPGGDDFPCRLERESRFLELPTAKGRDAGIIGPWRGYAKEEERCLQDMST